MLSEQKVQTKRIKELESQGYYVIKLIKTNKNGIPDIIALHPEKGVLFSEIKKADGKLSPLQKYRIEELKQKGFNVEVHYGTND
jgi:Holliday junction resolvase